MKHIVTILDPALEFIDAQDDKMQAKILRSIGLLKLFGYELREPHVKKIQGVDNLFELRIKVATNICRLFYFHHTGKVYVVTSGFVKKEDKTNPREIERAIKIMNEYIRG